MKFARPQPPAAATASGIEQSVPEQRPRDEDDSLDVSGGLASEDPAATLEAMAAASFPVERVAAAVPALLQRMDCVVDSEYSRDEVLSTSSDCSCWLLIDLPPSAFCEC